MSTASCLSAAPSLQIDNLRALATEAMAKLRHPSSVTPDPIQNRIDCLCDAFCADDTDPAADLLRQMRREGVSSADIVAEILPRAAHRIGERWADDTASFADVTIAVGRMQRVLRDLAPSRAQRAQMGNPILLIVPPEEDHTFGLFVAADALRRRGADVELSVQEAPDALRARLDARAYSAVGLSGARQETIPAVRRTVDTVRGTSFEGPLLLGGAVAQDGHDLREETGVDVVVSDPVSALSDLGLLRV